MNAFSLLINKYNKFDEETIKKISNKLTDTNEGGIEYDGSIHRSERLYGDAIDKFNELKDELAKKGYNFFVESGYRGYNDQINLWFSRMILASIDEYGHPIVKPAKKYFERLIAHLCIDDYPNWYKEDPLKRIEGILSIIGKTADYDLETIRKNVEFEAAPPGASEHHLGLAFDIGLLDNNRKNCDLTKPQYIKAAYDFIKLAPDYGFILRYPNGKGLFTGCKEEIWHYRYVGSPEIAHEIMDNNLTLEEYHIANYIINNNLLDQFENGSIDYSFLIPFIGEDAAKTIYHNPDLLNSVRNYINKKLSENYDNELNNGKKRI